MLVACKVSETVVKRRRERPQHERDDECRRVILINAPPPFCMKDLDLFGPRCISLFTQGGDEPLFKLADKVFLHFVAAGLSHSDF